MIFPCKLANISRFSISVPSLNINEEEAIAYLDSLAALFESYRDFLQKRDQDR